MIIDQLLLLQRLDLEIDAMEGEAKVFPDKLKEIRSREETKKKALALARDRLNQLEVERRDMDGTLKLEEERLKKSKKKLGELKKDYEIRAMTREIELTRRSNAELEENMKKKAEEIETAKKAVEQIETEWKTISEELEAARPEAEGKSAEFGALLETKYRERSVLEKEMDKVILNRYRRIRVRQHKDAFTRVEAYSCQGCFMNVPPQMVHEMMRNKRIENCPHCFRLIYVPAEPNA